MACEVCEHCQSPVSREDRVMVNEGFSYHKRCHKCYVCSETNLANAEVFKGVIFCSSCAQRIFQGCSTARKTKTMHSGRMKRTRSRSHRRRERMRFSDRRTDRSRDGVIELAGLAGSTTDSDEVKKQKENQKLIKSSRHTMSTENTLQVGKNCHEETCFLLPQVKRCSTEMGTTTDVTQELLRQINNCPVTECKIKTHMPPAPRKHHRKRENIIPNSKPICSDLRMAELGVSTEIANMALRKKSEVPVIIKSDTRLKERPSYSLSVLNQESDMSGDGREWMDSVYSTIEESVKTSWMDRRLGSLLTLPLKSFKKNILNRSSLISVLMSKNTDRNMTLFRRIKDLFYEEVTEHQGRGVKKLYSAINRRKAPYKLGWVELVANVSNVFRGNDHTCMCKRRCKHFRDSHSYRCMRAHVMKLAGPTNSELACYRHKIKKIVAPQFLRNIVNSNKNYAAIKMSQPCGSRIINSKNV